MDRIMERCLTEVVRFDPDYIIINADRWKSTKPSPARKKIKQFAATEKIYYSILHPETVCFFIHAIKQMIAPQNKDTFYTNQELHATEQPNILILHPENMPYSKYSKALTQLSQKNKILLIVMPEILYQKYHIYPGDVHPNKTAHSIYANCLYEYLQAQLR